MVLPITYRMFDKAMEEVFHTSLDLFHVHSRVACVMLHDHEYEPLITRDIQSCKDPEERRRLEEDRHKLIHHHRWKRYCEESYPLIEQWARVRGTSQETLLCVRYVNLVKQYIPCCRIQWVPPENKDVSLPRSEVASRCNARRKTNGSLDNFTRFIVENIRIAHSGSLSEELFRRLDDYCSRVQMIPSATIRSMPINPETGKRGPYTMQDLLRLLKLSGGSAYYADKWKIAMIWWGWEPYPLNHEIEQELKTKYNIMSSYCEQRSMNREYLAIRFLTNVVDRIPRRIDILDFDIISTAAILQRYENEYTKIVRERHLPWTTAPLYGTW